MPYLGHEQEQSVLWITDSSMLQQQEATFDEECWQQHAAPWPGS